MIQRFAFILALCLFIPDLYIYLTCIRRLTTRLSLKIIWWLPTTIFVLLFIFAGFVNTDNPLSDRQDIISALGILMLLFGLPKLFFSLISLLGIVLHSFVRCFPQKFFTASAFICSCIIFAITFYGIFCGTTHFQVKNVSFTSSSLPHGFDGYRIVHISDIHSGSWKNNHESLEKLVDIINSQKADIILFTGDLVNQRASELDSLTQIFGGLVAKDGVISVLGNHDYGSYYHWKTPDDETKNMEHLYSLQKDMGWKLLRNENVIIHHNNDSIAVIGVENDGNPPFPQLADLTKATKGTDGMFKILLSHDPTHWRREVLPKTDIDLTLSGHTHGTQFKIGNFSPAKWIYREWGGMYKDHLRALYVNTGIGYVGLPFRFGVWPEITVLTLHE